MTSEKLATMIVDLLDAETIAYGHSTTAEVPHTVIRGMTTTGSEQLTVHFENTTFHVTVTKARK